MIVRTWVARGWGPEVGAAIGVGPGVGQGAEAEAVAELVEHDRKELDLGPLVPVNAVVPAFGETVGPPDARVEVGDDVVGTGCEVRARQAVGKRYVIPRAGERRVGEIADHRDRTGAPEDAAGRGAVQWIGIETGVDADLDAARQDAAPDRRCILEHVEALGADRGARVATHRGGGSGVV